MGSIAECSNSYSNHEQDDLEIFLIKILFDNNIDKKIFWFLKNKYWGKKRAVTMIFLRII